MAGLVDDVTAACNKVIALYYIHRKSAGMNWFPGWVHNITIAWYLMSTATQLTIQTNKNNPILHPQRYIDFKQCKSTHIHTVDRQHTTAHS